MKNLYIKQYFLRGLIFSGFGPIILGIVYLILSNSIEGFALTGNEVFLAIISTYLLAFIQAGSSVFNQIESWSIAKSLFFHFISIYIAYIVCYLVNSWIPFNWIFIGAFTGIFVLTYFIICIIVIIIIKKQARKLTSQLNTKNR
ncbi:MAG: DUF3021 domain-containing protein [Clostridia bacterium]|nr:DUF3021 domain-containing protein [Clostridia bacterium]